ncbi:MAG TPA: ADP-ribosylglycohydrolase family protein [Anaerovoracaceae bacterium]|nr:ADP-ribosylglycohydrolase family protein [Anaerovoracaceae bacterium]
MDLKSRIQGCLAGVMIGDALGMPVEMMTRQQILEKTNGEGITGFVTPIQRKISDTQNLEAGSTTDDWQLTEAIGKSLVRRKGFDVLDIALAHVEASEVSNFGWGGTTKLGLQQLKLYFDSRGKEGRSPFEWSDLESVKSKHSLGAGNGVAMKIAPVAILDVIKSQNTLYQNVNDVARLTHPSLDALNAAFALAFVITRNLKNSTPTIVYLSSFLSAFNYVSVDSEDKLKSSSIEDLIGHFGNSSIARQSVALAVAIHLRHPEDFRAGVLEACNVGGDTDTIASMVGAMTGARVGLEGIPEEWLKFNPNFQAALDLGEQLFQLGETK